MYCIVLYCIVRALHCIVLYIAYQATVTIFSKQSRFLTCKTSKKRGVPTFLNFSPVKTAVFKIIFKTYINIFQVFSLQIVKKYPFSIRTVRKNGSWISLQNTMHDRSASIFLFPPRFSASNESAGFDGKLWSVASGIGGGGGGWEQSNDESVLISDIQMLAGMVS